MRLFFVSCFIAGLCFAQTSRALTLAEVLGQVAQTHPAIAKAKWDVAEAKAVKRAQPWLADPKASLMFEEVGINNLSLGNADMTTYGISQEIPFPTNIVKRTKAAKAEQKAKEALYQGTSREVLFDAKKTYFALVAYKNRLGLWSETLGAYKQLMVSLTAKYASGEKAGDTKNISMDANAFKGPSGSVGADLLMARMKQVEVETQIADMRHQIDSLKAKLNLMRGFDVDQKITSLQMPPLKMLKSDFKNLEAKLESQNSDLRAMRFMIDKADKELGLAKGRLLPTIEPQFAYNQRQDRQNAYTLGVGFNIPLWAPRNAAEISAAYANKQKVKSDKETQELSLKEQFYYLIHHAHEHGTIVKKYSGEIVPLARAAYETTLIAYQAGLTDTRDVLQKLINYQQASLDYWEKWQDYQTEFAMLEQLIGEDL